VNRVFTRPEPARLPRPAIIRQPSKMHCREDSPLEGDRFRTLSVPRQRRHPSAMGHAPESQVRTRLFARAKRIRTIGPTLQPAEFRKSAQVLSRDDDGHLSRGRSVHGGTGSSNPPPSSRESANFRSLSPRTSTGETGSRTRRPYVLAECAAHQRQSRPCPDQR
jgi:hypothetical protein